MTEPVPVFEADIGELHLSDGAFAILERLARRPGEVGDDPLVREQAALLQSVSAIGSDGRFHPSLTNTIGVLRHPDAGFELTNGQRATRIWVTSSHAALLMAADEMCLRRLLGLPVTLLPEAIGRLVDLGPRPRPSAVARLSLWTLLADGVRRHWTLAEVTPGAHAPAAGIEVVDTDGGLWVVEPGVEDPMASASDPTAVWRAIIRLVRPVGSAPS